MRDALYKKRLVFLLRQRYLHSRKINYFYDSGKEERKKCEDAGMDEHLTKPFSVSDLQEALRKYSDSMGARRELKNQISKREDQENNLDKDQLEIFNLAALESIREVEKQTGKSLLPQLFEGFQSQMDEKLEEIESYIDQENATEIYKTAHAIKSMSANLGAERVRALAATVESSAKAGFTERIREDASRLRHFYIEFSDAFKPTMLEKIED